jgi:hypothetical protein
MATTEGVALEPSKAKVKRQLITTEQPPTEKRLPDPSGRAALVLEFMRTMPPALRGLAALIATATPVIIMLVK